MERFAACKLSLNEEKMRIVYCKDGKRRGEYKEITFEMRGWHLNRRVQLKFSDIAVEINAEVRGWMNYYGKPILTIKLSSVSLHNHCILTTIEGK